MYRIRIDATYSSAVVHCTCGFRDIARDRLEAAYLANGHEKRAHPDQSTTRLLLHRAKKMKHN